MTKDQMDAYFNDLTKLEDEFLKENDGEANEHGVYVYQSPSGNHIMNLSMFLRSYRDWLIEHKIVKPI